MIKRKYKRIKLGRIEKEVKSSDNYDLIRLYKELLGADYNNFRRFISELEKEGCFYYEEGIEVKTTFLSRILLPIFFITIVLFHIVGGSFKYVFTGNGSFDKEGIIYKFLTKWAFWGGYSYM